MAAVAVGHGDQCSAGVVVEGQPVAGEVFGAVEGGGQGGFVEAFEDEDLGAGEEGAVEFEARVLRGGADQGDRAVLDVGEEAVLLGAVEAVDLVDEQQGALAVGAVAAWRGLSVGGGVSRGVSAAGCLLSKLSVGSDASSGA
ncbi:hypothetical protein [Streptomyces sp. NPDC004658]|uniref:hypothetical protein n=1 Tax=Streptomyces sp. NPDC004658 TaxID=3154672 RepID=UPI0033A778A7